MDIKEKFDAKVKIEKEDNETTFLVKKKDGVDHTQFMCSLLNFIKKEKLLFHHPVGVAVFLITHEEAKLLKKQANVNKIGPIQINTNLLAKRIHN